MMSIPKCPVEDSCFLPYLNDTSLKMDFEAIEHYGFNIKFILENALWSVHQNIDTTHLTEEINAISDLYEDISLDSNEIDDAIAFKFKEDKHLIVETIHSVHDYYVDLLKNFAMDISDKQIKNATVLANNRVFITFLLEDKEYGI